MIAGLKLVEAWRYLAIGMGAFVLGFALYTTLRYHTGGLRTGIYRGARHVTAMALSYSLMVSAILVELIIRTDRDKALSLWLPVATLAYALGAWALFVLVKYRSQNPTR